ncbi:hypothetical protein Agub_g15458 [Astrephomene gubernaculifera]|uniref:Uncharacterized protein n=1 Tax=Astrephomene gubernaculifera TaxID=47775 RepID=A0AAD3E4P9_9CHLO|nr:hypothetical protein Agub_g15458 [Astrephomene gubernaculifera]
MVTGANNTSGLGKRFPRGPKGVFTSSLVPVSMLLLLLPSLAVRSTTAARTMGLLPPVSAAPAEMPIAPERTAKVTPDGDYVDYLFKRYMRCDEIPGFTLLEGRDAPTDLYDSPETGDLLEMAAACTKIAGCMGFNTNGWLKTAAAADGSLLVKESTSYSPCGGIYVKDGVQTKASATSQADTGVSEATSSNKVSAGVSSNGNDSIGNDSSRSRFAVLNMSVAKYGKVLARIWRP